MSIKSIQAVQTNKLGWAARQRNQIMSKTTNKIPPVRGRPPTITAPQRKTIWLDQSSIETALRLGNGNLSNGVRESLKRTK